MGGNKKNMGILKVAGIAVLVALFYMGCGDKGTGGGEEAYYHTITLDPNGGVVAPKSVTARQCLDCNWAAVSLPMPTRDGYTFRGWWTEKGGTGGEITELVHFGFLDGPGWDTTLYAHWTLTHYTITFDAHGGEVFPAHDTTGGDWRLASLPMPTRDDHEFDGWYMDVVGVREMVTESKVYREDVTLFAHWVYTGAHYTVTFDATGGAVDPPTDETDVGGMLQDLPTPERDGYAFDGWYTSESGGTEVTTNTVFNSPTTVYAQWILIMSNMYVVTFNAHGGTVRPKNGVTKEDGTLLKPLPTPEREGYAFKGWFSEDGVVSASTVFKSNTTIHAQWTILHYTITFDAAEGTVTPATGTTGPHWELTSLPTPVRSGYMFRGWFTETEGGMRVTIGMPLIGDQTVYAHWTPNDAQD
jgi:uncharacterized repeat protein (TIGR02543 family)